MKYNEVHIHVYSLWLILFFHSETAIFREFQIKTLATVRKLQVYLFNAPYEVSVATCKIIINYFALAL